MPETLSQISDSFYQCYTMLYREDITDHVIFIFTLYTLTSAGTRWLPTPPPGGSTVQWLQLLQLLPKQMWTEQMVHTRYVECLLMWKAHSNVCIAILHKQDRCTFSSTYMNPWPGRDVFTGLLNGPIFWLAPTAATLNVYTLFDVRPETTCTRAFVTFSTVPPQHVDWYCTR